jgi:hypothetical protein
MSVRFRNSGNLDIKDANNVTIVLSFEKDGITTKNIDSIIQVKKVINITNYSPSNKTEYNTTMYS